MNVHGTLGLIVMLLAGGVLLLFRRVRYIGLFVVSLAASATGYFVWQSNHWAAGFDAVTLGASEQEIILVVGVPQRITDGTLWVEPKYKKAKTELVVGCTKEYWYNVFYFPVAYSFCFNDRSELVHKYNWVMW